MSIDLTFDGTTAGLGKDGWYQLGRAELFVLRDDGEVIIELRGRGVMTDVQAMLHVYNPEDLKTLIYGLAKALAQMTTIREEPDHWSSPNGCHEDCPACKEETTL